MGRPGEQPDREQRIDDEVIVDAYDSTERAMSWYYYLEAKLRFPFAASCMARRQSSPLKVGERVKVVGMTSEDECMLEVRVMVTWSKAKLSVPLGSSSASRATSRRARPSRTGSTGLRAAMPSEACAEPEPEPAQRPRPDGGNDRHRSNMITRRTPDQCPRSWDECFEIFDL